jgi:hypothetical protein
MNKICKRCKYEKPTIEFGDNKNNKDGKSIYCKKCELERGKEYREKNREKVNKSAKDYRKNNPEKYKEVIEKYLEKNPNMTSTERGKKYRQSEEWRKKFRESGRKSYLKNIDKEREKYKEYYHKNKEKLRAVKNKWKSKRMKEDGFYRMKINLRARIREYLIGESKGLRTRQIVGLDKVEFKLYIQNKFVDGMSWENYGKWHLDHITPLCIAKDNEEALLLNHYTNLQPLWAEDNLKKGKKI